MIPMYNIRLYEFRRGWRFFDYKTNRNYIFAGIDAQECKLFSEGKPYYMWTFNTVRVAEYDLPECVMERRRNSKNTLEGLKLCDRNFYLFREFVPTQKWLDLIVNEPDEVYL